ncbi:hypothetical protein WGH24286_01385 [Periweissella ghanensis]|uniref:Potassium-transporting ATPase subunit F n=1 Tax=Periweissella ghanensis TaxID=467997 RepID=A0ABM8ZE41_9LACO|nr:hypothetical protein WGH24286_01385 [Periweissella ghanensis]
MVIFLWLGFGCIVGLVAYLFYILMRGDRA